MILDAACHCRLTTSDEARKIVPISLPLEESLPSVPTNEILVSRLDTAIGPLGDCAETDCCASNEAYQALIPLMAAHAAAAAKRQHWSQIAEEEARLLVARVLLRVVSRRGTSLMSIAVDALRANPGAFAQLLDDLCLIATYDGDARSALKITWQDLMLQALDGWPGQRKTAESPPPDRRLLASLIPIPKMRRSEKEHEQRFEEAGADWVDAGAIAPLMDRWLSLSRGVPECVDALAWFFYHRNTPEDVEVAISWVEGAINGRFDLIAGRTYFLAEWIEEVLKDGQLSESLRIRLRRLIDGLAAHGDSRALRVQRTFGDA